MERFRVFVIAALIQILLFFVLLIVHYYAFYGRIEREFLRLDPYLVEYITVYCFSILFVCFISIIKRHSTSKLPFYQVFQPFQSALIPILFLILSTVFVSPMSFILLFSDLRRNIILHLFAVSLIPHLYFLLKRKLSEHN